CALPIYDIRAGGERRAGAMSPALARGDVAGARTAFETGSAQLDSDEPQTRFGNRLLEAKLLRAERRLPEALAAAVEALAIRELSTLHPFYKQAWIEACEAAIELADEAQVEELLGEVERLPPSDRPPGIVTQEARFRGRLFALRGDRDRAAELLSRAVDGFRTIQTPYPLAIALVEQAEQGVDDPTPLLAEAREIFVRLGAKPWL